VVIAPTRPARLYLFTVFMPGRLSESPALTLRPRHHCSVGWRLRRV